MSARDRDRRPTGDGSETTTGEPALEGREARVAARRNQARADAERRGDDAPDRLRPELERPEDDGKGSSIITASWVGTGLFALVSIPAAFLPDTFAPFLIVVSLAMFLIGSVVFVIAFLTAVGRSREVLIGMGGLFFLAGGTAPRRVSRHLMGSFALECALAVATTVIGLFTVPADVTNPVAFGVLAPIFGMGLAGLWSARYGHFAERPPEPATRGRRTTS